VLVLRNETERPERVVAGVARLVGSDPAAILSAASELIADDAAHAGMVRGLSLYGDGHAGRRIAEAIRAHLTGSAEISSLLRSPVATG
jgi:UDP-N-acetylglucosamine 2-epimerase (non-hydrolysing)